MRRTIATEFWSDPDVRALSVEARYLLLYWITAPGGHFCGIYYSPLQTAAHETGLALDRISVLKDELSAAGRIEYDDARSVIWIRKMLLHQTGQHLGGPKVRESIRRHLSQLHRSPLIERFVQFYKLDLVTESSPNGYPIDGGSGNLAISSPIDRVSIGYRKGIDTLSKKRDFALTPPVEKPSTKRTPSKIFGVAAEIVEKFRSAWSEKYGKAPNWTREAIAALCRLIRDLGVEDVYARWLAYLDDSSTFARGHLLKTFVSTADKYADAAPLPAIEDDTASRIEKLRAAGREDVIARMMAQKGESIPDDL